jgi:hypothetical protein
MKNLFLITILLFFFSCYSSISKPNPQFLSTPQTIDFKLQWDTIHVLKNPYKGWYHHLLDNGVQIYAIKDEAIFRM